MKFPIQRGYIAIMTVLSLLVFSLSLLVSMPYLSIGGAQQASALLQGEVVLSVLEGCAEDALLQSARDENYTGGESNFFEVHCSTSIEKNDTVWTLHLEATKENLVRTLVVIVERPLGTPSTIAVQSFLEQ